VQPMARDVRRTRHPTWSAFSNKETTKASCGRSVDSLPPRRALLVLPAAGGLVALAPSAAQESISPARSVTRGPPCDRSRTYVSSPPSRPRLSRARS
jgi:hypothetical protein